LALKHAIPVLKTNGSLACGGAKPPIMGALDAFAVVANNPLTFTLVFRFTVLKHIDHYNTNSPE
jgi:hypothetical protein